MRLIICLIAAGVASLLVAGCRGASDSGTQTNAQASPPAQAQRPAVTGILTGRVGKGPMTPVEPVGVVRSNAPAPGVKITISTPGGKEVASVVTDQQGEYKTALPPGVYRIAIAPRPGEWLFSKDLPATVTLEAGREKRLDVLLDTGIR